MSVSVSAQVHRRMRAPLNAALTVTGYSMNGFGNMFGALTAYGTGLIDYDKFLSWR